MADPEPADEFSLEVRSDREISVRHRASGHVYRFTINGAGLGAEPTIVANPETTVVAESLGAAARRAALEYIEAAPIAASLTLSGTTPVVVQNVQAVPAASGPIDAALPPLGRGPSIDLRTSVVPGFITRAVGYPDTEAIIPQQASGGSQFRLDESGRIDLVPDPPANTDRRQRELYDELRRKTRELSGLGHNQLGDLSTTIDIFGEALPENIEAVSITRLWSRGNTLRRRLSAHEIAVGSADPSDPARLTPLVAGQLRDLVETFNVFIAGEPEGSVLEQARLGPQERDSRRAILVAAEPIVEALQSSPDVATPSAAQALTEQIEAAQDALSATGVDSDQAVALAGNSSSNAVITLLRQGVDWLGLGAASDVKSGFYRSIGNALGVGAIGGVFAIAKFIVDHADALKAFVDAAFHNPALRHVIDAIVQAASSATPQI